MFRILQCVNNMDRAGLETMIMNYYRHIDRSQIQFDFLMHRPERSDYDDEIEAMGGRIYRAPRLYPQNYPAYFRYMRRFFSEHLEYHIIHSHIDAMSFLPLLAAKRAGIPVRIGHSHSTFIADSGAKRIIKQVFRFLLPRAANCYLACGKEAGAFLFGNEQVRVIPNAISKENFVFSQVIRDQKREELGISNEFVVGHVGRFQEVKNHKFLIDVFCELLHMRPESILVLVGCGSLLDEIQQLAKQRGISDQVRFLGNRCDVNELYQAMDVFVLPSFFEGIPVVGIEAQFSGLPCVFSDTIANEVSFSPKCSFLSVKLPAKAWCEQIINVYEENKRETPVDSDWYNIRVASKMLMEFYQGFRD